MKGKAIIGRKSVSPKIGDQCASADKHLKTQKKKPQKTYIQERKI